MISIELSRRAGKIVGDTRSWRDLSNSKRDDFFDELGKAKTFDSLAKWAKKVITDGEAE